MALILLILQIIEAIPTIFSIIHEIMKLIDGLNGQEKKAAQAQFTSILRSHKGDKDHVAIKADLLQFHKDIKEKYGV